MLDRVFARYVLFTLRFIENFSVAPVNSLRNHATGYPGAWPVRVDTRIFQITNLPLQWENRDGATARSVDRSFAKPTESNERVCVRTFPRGSKFVF